MIQPGDTIINKRTGQTIHFLQTGEETNGKLLRMECTSPNTAVKEPEHTHPRQTNRFQLLAGTLHFQIDGVQKLAKAGETVEIPPGTPHFFWNAGKEEARYIQEFEPALQIDQFFELLFYLANTDQLNAKGTPNVFRMAVALLHYQKEIRLTRPPWPLQWMVFQLLAPIGKLRGYTPQVQVSKS